MPPWNRAFIKYEYSPVRDANPRSVDLDTINTYGKSEGAALQHLRKLYPTRADFLILQFFGRSCSYTPNRRRQIKFLAFTALSALHKPSSNFSTVL
jgi:hypothetical protein